MTTARRQRDFVRLVVIEPTFDHYKDTGCVESPTCLVCPMEKCRHDDPAWYHKELRKRRYAKMAAVADSLMQKMSVTQAVVETADQFGVADRTIWRALKHRDDGT